MPKAKSTYWKVIGPDRYEYGDTLPDGAAVKAGEGDYATAFAYAWQINSPAASMSVTKREMGHRLLRVIGGGRG